MKLTSIIVFLSIFLVSCASKVNPTEYKIPQKPNILFVLVDDLGYRDLGYTGSTFYETPNINNLAKQGMVFTQGYASSQVCSPSRASILTGQFTARHGITDWIGENSGTDWRKMNRFDKTLPAEYVHNLPEGQNTVAEVLEANGYKTFFAGKWHLGDEGSYPEDHGFQINKGGWNEGGPVGGYFAPFKNPKLEDQHDGENLSMRLANETVSFMKENKESSFFAFLSFYAVHGPIQTNEEKWKKYRDKAVAQGIKENGFAMESKLPLRQHQDNPVYGGLVESMDYAVGLVLNSLKELGLDKNTIVIFTSDNGGVASGDSFSTSNLPFRGGKGYQWEGGIREPYIIYVPWANSNGKTNDSPVTGADFFPTILDYAHIDLLPEQHKDGVSLKPVVDNGMQLSERPLYWHYPHYGNQGGDPSSMIRLGDFKLIHYYEDNHDELYNLLEDPYEHKNIANSSAEITNKLSKKLLNWLTEVNAKYPADDDEFDKNKLESYHSKVTNELWPKLEKERKDMLSEKFKPNANWWGSKMTKD
jgi:arylsulfatase A-like enzyme